jgi:hypothetical protein
LTPEQFIHLVKTAFEKNILIEKSSEAGCTLFSGWNDGPAKKRTA